MHIKEFTGRKWIEILRGIVAGEEPDGPLPGQHDLEEIFDHLESDSEVSDDQIALLEFPLIKAFSHGKRKTRALDRQIASNPKFFIELLSYVFNRSDDNKDPEELSGIDMEHRRFLAGNSYETLTSWRLFPGLSKDGTFDEEFFEKWNSEVLHLVEQAGRGRVAMSILGEAYAYSPPDTEGNWPSLPVCNLLDSLKLAGLREGFRVGVSNSRGVWRKSIGEGGRQERDLSEKYRLLFDKLHTSHPRLAGVFRDLQRRYLLEAEHEEERAIIEGRWRG